MRNPERLDNLYDTLKELHKEKTSDIRFGQLMYLFEKWAERNKGVADLFYVEDEEMLDWIKEFFKV